MAYGTLLSDAIQSSTASTPPVFKDGNGTAIGQLCRAWVSFAGSTGTINSSFNVSSITRFAGGGYTVNFTNAMANTTYSVAASSCSLSATYLYTFMTPFSNFSGYAAPSTSAFSMIFVGSNGGASWTGGDPTVVNAAVFGN